MLQSFRTSLSHLLPSEERLVSHLQHLKPQEVRVLADYFAATLPEFDVVIALPHGAALGAALASTRGVPCLLAHPQGDVPAWSLDTSPADDIRSAVIVTDYLTTGLAELEVALLAAVRGWQVSTVAATVERSNDQGRARLELQGIAVRAGVYVAATPKGLILERRFPQPH